MKIRCKLCLFAFTSIFSLFSNPSLKAENPIRFYAERIPGINSISDTIDFDGITISQFRFENNKKYFFVKPRESLQAHIHISIDESYLKTLHLHHLIIGLYEEGPQACITHPLATGYSTDGDATITLRAPDRKGLYQVRFCHTKGMSESQARESWGNVDSPSSRATAGILIVK